MADKKENPSQYLNKNIEWGKLFNYQVIIISLDIRVETLNDDKENQNQQSESMVIFWFVPPFLEICKVKFLKTKN